MNDALGNLGGFGQDLEQELKSKTTTVELEGVTVTMDWTFSLKSIEFDIEKINFNEMVKLASDGTVEDATGVSMLEIQIKNAFSTALSKAKEEVQQFTIQKMQSNPEMLGMLQQALKGGGQQ
jgi:DNA-binding protein YbaB